jgi:glycine/D-amino acid oxidase-like deaminating enzyme
MEALTGSSDVVVIGGGIVGVSAAAHLAETGRHVTLVERTSIGAGASGRNSGVVQHPFDPVLIDHHLETVELYRSLADAPGADGFALPPAPAGLLNVTYDVDGAAALAEHIAASHPTLGAAFLDPVAARDVEPALAEGVAACRLDIGYPVGPLAATSAYARWAAHLGVRIVEGADATVVVEGDRAVGVAVADGRRHAAGTVVVAAGPWSPGLVDQTGRWRPIRPLWGVVVTIDLEAAPRHVLEEAEIEIEPGLDEGSGGVAFSLVTADGSSSLGSTFLDEEPDAAALVPTLVERGRRFVPGLGHARIGAHRTCARPLSRDGRPLVGEVPWTEGLWIAAGHGPWGISTGPATGRLVADLIAGRVAAPPPALDPARFRAS